MAMTRMIRSHPDPRLPLKAELKKLLRELKEIHNAREFVGHQICELKSDQNWPLKKREAPMDRAKIQRWKTNLEILNVLEDRISNGPHSAGSRGV
jgi:hypothetical protein